MNPQKIAELGDRQRLGPHEFRPEWFMGRDVDLLRDKEWFDMAGRRGCPGSNMAIVNMNLLSAQLFNCFEWSVEGDLDMTEGPALSMSRSAKLVALPRLRLTRHSLGVSWSY